MLHHRARQRGHGRRDSRDGIRARLEGSLTRLGVDAVDIVLLHDVEGRLREVYETGFPALAELRAQGVVRAIGFGMNHSGPPARPVAGLDVDVVLDRSPHLAAVCAEFAVPLKAAALRFPFGHRAVAGAAAPEEMAENARLFTHDIPDSLWHTLVAAACSTPICRCP
ncbi:aldo/keto reductase [Streptomyces sp. NPDC048612]|uniref:aldo/keto reductase n=1 Tax=Streptomyces sp. NPDC048612 TaxID=3365579 RepID=UPI003724252A